MFDCATEKNHKSQQYLVLDILMVLEVFNCVRIKLNFSFSPFVENYIKEQ